MSGLLSKVLGSVLGDKTGYEAKELIFDKVIGFKGVVDGVGCSTIIHNVAHELGSRGFYVGVIDTHCMYPVLANLLAVKRNSGDTLDLMDYRDGYLKEIVHPTKYKNVFLIDLVNRNEINLISNQDNTEQIELCIKQGKNFFDIILIDISTELSQISWGAALNCDKIYPVIEPSVTCLTNMVKSLTALRNQAVPKAVFTNVIINKNIKEIEGNIKPMLEELSLNPVVYLPFSTEIYLESALGKSLINTNIMAKAIIKDFETGIGYICDHIIQGKTGLTSDGLNLNEVEE